ncbi:MAG: hypothetical protein ACO32J_05675 [Phycisphaerales bacterium]
MSLAIRLSTMLRNACSALAALVSCGMWTLTNHRHGRTVMVPVKAGPRRVR